MQAPPKPHDVLRRFESEYRHSQCSAHEFLQHSTLDISPRLQLEVIAVFLGLKFQSGVRPNIGILCEEFPHFAEKLPLLLAETVADFFSQHCPIKNKVRCFPATFGNFEVVREISRGGMGVVYEALQRDLNRLVALKVLFFNRETIAREAELLGVFNHPQICQVYHVGVAEGLPYVAMQYVRGRPLSKLLEGHFFPHETVCIVAKIASTLEAIHSRNVAHLDVKPNNIMIDPSGAPILIDFGLATRTTANGIADNTTEMATTAYSAPECFGLQFGKVSLQSDVYSLGLVLYEMLTKRRPFNGLPDAMIEQMRVDPPRRLSDYCKEINAALEQICLQAIEVNQVKRTASMTDFREALQGWLSEYRSGLQTPPVDLPRIYSTHPRLAVKNGSNFN